MAPTKIAPSENKNSQKNPIIIKNDISFIFFNGPGHLSDCLHLHHAASAAGPYEYYFPQ